MNNKKGISAIVATVLIILITVAAVTIIWAAIIPMVSTNLEKGQVCLDAAQGGVVIVDEGYTCYNAGGPGIDNMTIQIGHGSKDFDLEEVQVIVSAGGNSATFNLEEASGRNVPGINERATYFVNSLNFTAVNTATELEEVSIAPIVRLGGRSTETCDIVSTLEIRPCGR